MDKKSDFNEFLRDWLQARIKPLGEYVDPSDQAYIARERARELTDLAKEQGFYADLVGYLRRQSVLKFVEDQYWRVNLMQKDQ
ncbi:hypothetical protein [Agrobacterium tumefaciens]|uniref:hypothetical protein n=1 Tax=Agrobacterium tumefaciens TaxID=358 RepID=UPI003BA20C06